MNGSPAFQFYPADWLSDEKASAMSIEGEGCYIRLLCYCWREGSIPADREAIARLCKGYDGPGIDEALSCFSPSRKKTRLVHKRLETERIKQEKFSKSCRDRGLSGANKRWLSHSPAIATPIAKNGSLSLSSSSELREKNKSSSLCPRTFADVDIRLTQLLVEFMKKNNPDSSILKHLTEKRRSEWINQCRLLREADGRSLEQIEAVIRFSQADEFWCQNILSMPKLREKWDQLWLKAKASMNRGGGNGRGAESPYVGSRSSIPSIDKDLEKNLLAEYEVTKAKFMKAKGYKTEDDIPFTEYETFFMFKNRRVREMKQGGASC